MCHLWKSTVFLAVLWPACDVREWRLALFAALDTGMQCRRTQLRCTADDQCTQESGGNTHQPCSGAAQTGGPVVVQVDCIWISVQISTDTCSMDRKGCKRQQRPDKRMVVLVTPGLWSDRSGHRLILDWEVADCETATAWEIIPHHLQYRRVHPEHGLKMPVRDDVVTG